MADATDAEEVDRVSTTFTTGPDGAVWVIVDGADLEQLVARIGAVCEVLIPEQPTRR